MYSREDFYQMVGKYPEYDDLDRLNCDKAGTPGHMCCGYCKIHEVPMFICGCYGERVNYYNYDNPQDI